MPGSSEIHIIKVLLFLLNSIWLQLLPVLVTGTFDKRSCLPWTYIRRCYSQKMQTKDKSSDQTKKRQAKLLAVKHSSEL